MTTEVRERSRTTASPTRSNSTLFTVSIFKALGGVALLLTALLTWITIDDLSARQATLSSWDATSDYAVFYPHYNGNDLDEFQTNGQATKLAEARDLYPYLDARGAIYVDASNYAPGVFATNPWLPTSPIRVNSNYLEQYPVLDDNQQPIRVDPSETDWVIAVPDKYKPNEERILEFFRAARIGGPDFEGAVQGQQAVLGEPAPVQFETQKVKIVWTASNQSIFSFDTRINSDSGSLITDPIIEVMTRDNSLPIDRINAITGDLNTPMKVLVESDPAAELKMLTPKLQELKLDDNLLDLVTASEAITQEIDGGRSALTWVVVGAGLSALLTIVLGVVFVVVGTDRLRRTITVKRLHGYSLIRAHSGLWMPLGAVWLVQAVVTCVVVVLLSTVPDPLAPAIAVNAFDKVPRLLFLIAVVVVIDSILVFSVARKVEHKKMSQRLKEL